jgi:opacity protein-like surface antigen
MNLVRCSSLAALALTLFASAALAQPGVDEFSPKRLVSIGVGGGMTVPVSDASLAFKNGINAQGFVRLNLPLVPVKPRFDLCYSRFDLDDVQLGVPGTGQILAGLANLQFFIMPAGPVRPYLIAGLGAYNMKTETEGAGAASVSETRFGINGGAGVAIHLGPANAYLEGRVDNVYTQAGLIDSQQVRVIPVTFGIVF